MPNRRPSLLRDPRTFLGLPLAALAVALGARIDVPMVPVPMTLQSLAVVLAGGLLGPVRGACAMVLYLAAGAAGLPVFAGGTSGLEVLTGQTAGYLWAFPLAAGLSGLGPDDPSPAIGRCTALFFGVHLLILGLGALWLARSLGFGPALAHGFWPFLPGATLKSFAAVPLVVAWRPGLRPARGSGPA